VSRRIGLVGCVKTKLDRAAPARDLYTSPLFRGRRAYVEQTCSSWFVLSAKHGLVDPHTVLEPYDLTLDSASSRERRAWSTGVLEALRKRVGRIDGLTFEAHAGSNYLDFGLVDGLVAAGAEVVRPARGLGLFEQQAFYATGGRREPPARSLPQRTRVPSGGKYATLAEYLRGRLSGTVTVSFEDVAEIVGGLPRSALNHRAWWANDESHAQGRAWLQEGWRVEAVDLEAARVTFQKLD
jgi:hypothetical protein